MTFAQRRNRQTTHFSERIPVVKRRISVYEGEGVQLNTQEVMDSSINVGLLCDKEHKNLAHN